MREQRHSPRDAELDRLARVELTALLDLEDAERKQKLLRRMHREVMHGGRYRVGSQGGAQSRFARVCRQYRASPRTVSRAGAAERPWEPACPSALSQSESTPR